VQIVGTLISIPQQPLSELSLVVADQPYSVHCTLTNAAKNSAVNSSTGDIPTASIPISVQE
jgi:hypothetical protein